MDEVKSELLLRRMVESQATNARTWIAVFQRHGDLSSVKNAIEAMARWYGMYKSYRALFGDDENMPPSLQKDFDEFRVIREQLYAWDGRVTH